MIMITLHVQELWLLFSKTFRCGSNKCLYDKACAVTLIEMFEIGTGDSIASRDKIAPYKGETFFLFCLIIGL